jgi:putative transposase
MPHHVVQRGNRRMATFFGEDDYRAYLGLLKDWCGRYGVRIWAYCLMPNHVHLVLVPGEEKALAAAVGQVHVRYTRRINFRENWRGFLWQGRFSSAVMDEMYLLRTTAYTERNPVKARLATRAEQWRWSSAAAHVSGRSDGIVEVDWLAERVAGWVCAWGEYLAGEDCESVGRLLRRGETTGRPIGDDGFLATIGRLVGRDLTPKKRGRKPKRKRKQA